MSHYRLVGIQCDWNDGECEEQVELTGGATFPNVWAEARKHGWFIDGGSVHLCPEHKNMS